MRCIRILVKRERGQSLVEMSIMLVVMIWLLLGILDLGRAFFYYLALRDAAGEGAYYASIHPTWASSADKADPDNVTYRVKHASPVGGLINWTGAAVSVSAPGTTPGNFVTVTVTANYTLLTPLVNNIIGGDTLPMTGRAVAKIISPGP